MVRQRRCDALDSTAILQRSGVVQGLQASEPLTQVGFLQPVSRKAQLVECIRPVLGGVRQVS